MSCSIFVCHHKPCDTVQNEIVIPLHVGKKVSNFELGFLGDDTGVNISDKNPYYCELTATYWIWKNINSDIVGLFHYRRFLNFKNAQKKVHSLTPHFLSDFGITKENIEHVLNEYDLILPKKSKSCKKTIYEFYNIEHIQSDMDLLILILTKKYPQYADKIIKTFKENSQGYFANMLIAKKDVFDTYAAWLFDILFEIENSIQDDVLKRDTYQQRVYGFLAERLMSIFVICHPYLKIKELPVLYVEDDLKKWRKYQFRQFKRKILNILGQRKNDEN